MHEADRSPGSGPAAAVRPATSWWLRGLVGAIGIGALLAAAWMLRTDSPRELPFPDLEPEMLFPESVPRPRVGTTAEPSTAASPATVAAARFRESLRQRASAPLPGASQAPQRTPGRALAARLHTLPLGGGLVADLSADGATGTWRWATTGWATLAVLAPTGDRPVALVYAEPLSPAYPVRPTAELLRFKWTALPISSRDLPLVGGVGSRLRDPDRRRSGTELASRIRAERLDATATSGRGLGFAPSEKGFTGRRWVGRNDHRVVLRLGRFEGTWNAQVTAYLLLGSAVAPDETLGAHVALLCARSPDCPAADQLAAFLASIRPGEPALIQRLLAGPQDSFEELARSAGLELTEPRIEAGGEGVP